MNLTSLSRRRALRGATAALTVAVLSTIAPVTSARASGSGAPTPTLEVSRPFDLARASVTPNGAEAQGASWGPSVSDSGRYTVFTSSASNMPAAIMLYDLNEDETNPVLGEVIDPAPGDPATRAIAGTDPVISGGGDHVAWIDYSGVIRITNRATYATSAVTMPVPSFQTSLAVSDGGGKVAFVAQPQRPPVFDGDGQFVEQPDIEWKVYVGTPGEAAVEMGSAGIDDFPAGVAIAGNGSYLTWVAHTGDDNFVLYGRDLTSSAGPVLLADLGLAGNGHAGRPSITDDGNTVAAAAKRDLVSSIITVDVDSKVETLLSPFDVETPAISGTDAVISGDGSTVAFEAFPRFHSGGFDNPPYPQVYAVDLATDRVLVASSNAADEDGAHGHSGLPSINHSGDVISFETAAANLWPGDTNDTIDVLVARRGPLAGLSARPTWPAGAGVDVDSSGENHLNVSWDVAADDVAVTGYRLFVNGSLVETFAGGVTSYTISGLAAETTYQVAVEAFDSDGQATATRISASGTTAESGAGEPEPEITTALSSVTVTGGVQLSWAPLGRTSFVVERAVGNGAFAELAQVANAATYIDRSGNGGVLYRYRVRALVADQLKSHTLEKTFTFPNLSVNGAEFRPVVWNNRFYDIVEYGAEFNLHVTGSPYRTAVARLAVKTWRDEAGTGYGTVLRDAVIDVPLTESAEQRGLYSGVYAVGDGIAELVSVTGVVSDAAGEVTRQAPVEPVPVTGAVRVTLTRNPELTQGAYLQASSNETAGSWNSATLTAGSTHLLPLRAGEAYDVAINSGTGFPYGEVTGVDVVAGRVTDINFTPVRPATVSVQVTDGSGVAVPNVSVQVRDAANDRWLGVLSTDHAGVATFSGLAEDQQVIASATSRDLDYAKSSADVPVTLTAGTNSVDVTLPKLARSQLRGTVVYDAGAPEPGPISSAYVSGLVRMPDGRVDYVSGHTGADGTFAFDVPAGTAELTVSAPQDGYVTLDPATVVAGADTDVGNIVFFPVRPYTVDLSLRTEAANGSFLNFPLSAQVASEFGLYLSGPNNHSRPETPQVTVFGRPGDVIDFCSDTELRRACTAFTLGTDTSKQLTLTKATGVTGQVRTATGVPERFYVTLYKVGADDSLRYVSARHFNAGTYNVGVLSPGEYELGASSFEGQGTTRFTVADMNEDIVLDTITLAKPSDRLVRDGDTSMRALRPTVLPGGVVEFRASVHNRVGLTAAEFVADIPAGTTVVPDSVLLDGEPVAGGSGSTISVPLGDLDNGDVRVLRYRVRLDGTAGVAIEARARVTHADGDEFIGAGRATVEALTMEAPGRSSTRDIVVTGRGPAGGTVRVLAGRAVLGHAVPTPGGAWRMPVTLPDVGRSASYQLRAELVESGAVTATVAPQTVQVDTDDVELTAVRVGQVPIGRLITFDPREGVAKFPYVFRPHLDTTVRLSFSAPDNVKNVTATIDSTTAVATRDGSDWVAVVSSRTFGSVSVDWDVVTVERVLGVPSDEQVLNRLPAGMADNTATIVTSVDPVTGADVAAGPITMANGDVFDVEISLDRDATYTPTAEESAAVDASGYPVYGLTYTVDNDHTDGEISAVMEAYVPLDLLPADAQAASVGDSRSFAAQSFAGESMPAMLAKALRLGAADVAPMEFASAGFSTAGFSFNPFNWGKARVKVKVGNAEDAWKGTTAKYDLEQAAGAGGKYDRLRHLQDWYNNCDPVSKDILSPTGEEGGPGGVELQLKNAAEGALPAADAVSGALSIAGLKINPGPFRGGVLFIMQAAGGAAQDGGLNAIFSNIEGKLESVGCGEPPGGGDGSGEAGGGANGSDAGSDGDGSGGPGGSGGSPVATPTPIYDPSGYVYEGLPSNRLEDVTATVLFRETENGVPTVWDATWFEQINPQQTNGEGRYGWDVPEGFWQVVYAKDGYVTGYSDVLKVLPPHFDVNEGLLSFTAPTVTVMSATTGALDVTFSKPMTASSVDPHLTVTAVGVPVAGAVTALDAETDLATGREVAVRFRFTPAVPFAGGTSLEVGVGTGAVSYALVGLAAAHAATVAVPAAPANGVVPPTDGVGLGGVGERMTLPAPSGPERTSTVTVQTPAGPMTITLNGTDGGALLVRPLTAAPFAGGFTLLGNGYDISTTAAFTTATVCIPYSDSAVEAAGLTEESLVLFHGNADGTVSDLTGTRDSAANKVCGTTSSFSPFVLGVTRSTRVAGLDRYATAAQISASRFAPGVPVAYVVSGVDFPDALAAGPSAVRDGAPILLSGRDSLPAATVAELTRLRPGRIVVVGGEAVLTAAISEALGKLTAGTITRVAGVDRYATAAKVSDAWASGVDVVYVATGDVLADGLAAGAVAARDGAPLLLVRRDSVPAATAASLARLRPARVVIVGGTAAVSAAAANTLARTAPVSRIAGPDRYATSALVAKAVGSKVVFVANGLTAADALAGIPAVAAAKGALVLVEPGKLPAATAELLELLDPTAVTVFGGTAAVGRQVELDAARRMG